MSGVQGRSGWSAADEKAYREWVERRGSPWVIFDIGDNVVEFLNDFEDWCRLTRVSKEDKYGWLRCCLKGNAKLWYKLIVGPRMSKSESPYEQLRNKLLQTFGRLDDEDDENFDEIAVEQVEDNFEEDKLDEEVIEQIEGSEEVTQSSEGRKGSSKNDLNESKICSDDKVENKIVAERATMRCEVDKSDVPQDVEKKDSVLIDVPARTNRLNEQSDNESPTCHVQSRVQVQESQERPASDLISRTAPSSGIYRVWSLHRRKFKPPPFRYHQRDQARMETESGTLQPRISSVKVSSKSSTFRRRPPRLVSTETEPATSRVHCPLQPQLQSKSLVFKRRPPRKNHGKYGRTKKR